MLSDLKKKAFKMASEDPQKDIAKKSEKHEILRLLSDLWGLNCQSYQLSEVTFR